MHSEIDLALLTFGRRIAQLEAAMTQLTADVQELQYLWSAEIMAGEEMTEIGLSYRQVATLLAAQNGEQDDGDSPESHEDKPFLGETDGSN